MADWKQTLETRLPEYGHRNWIVVADAAYPKQSAAGIETVATGADQLQVLREVLAAIESADHVRPVIMLDAELDFVAEDDAPGVERYRAELKKIIAGRSASTLPHEEIIRKLDEGSRLFNVLLLKTRMTIPYTTVFIELDCGYWSAEKEARLRKAFEAR